MKRLISIVIPGLVIAACEEQDTSVLVESTRPTISGCRVTDGDTIRCGDERIRLLGIDAPEMAGHCRPGRNCAPGDPLASTDHLRNAMHAGQLTIERHGTDHYGRTLAHIYAGSHNLSCEQLKSGNAIYRDDWDEPAGRLQRECDL